MAWIEHIEKRSRNAKHYQDSQDPAKWRAEITIHDRHYHDGTAWQDVDEALQADTTGGYVRACTKQRHVFRVGNAGERQWLPRREVATEYVTLGRPEYWNGSRWRQIAMPNPAWSGNRATWDMANVTVTLENTWSRIKASFLLKDSTAPTRLRFPATFTGLTYDPATGALASGGAVRGYIAAPTAVDANGAAVACTASYAGGYIEWGVTTTGAAYPVDVDPTLTLPPGDRSAGEDTYIYGAFANNNYGIQTAIFVGAQAILANKYRGLLRMALTGMPGGAVASAATLSLYAYNNAEAGARNIAAHRALTQWYEGSMNGGAPSAGQDASTWGYRNYNGSVAWAGGAGGGSGSDYAAAPTATVSVSGNGSYSWNVLDDVAAWLGGTPNYGWWLLGDEAATMHYKGFATSKYNIVPANRPLLTIDYDLAATGTVRAPYWGRF